MHKVSNFFACLFLIALFFSSTLHAQAVRDSDIKKNIQPLSQPVETIAQLQPRVYQYDQSGYKHLNLPAGTRYGFIAEDVQKVIPGMVSYKKVSYMKGKNLFQSTTVPYINMENLVPLLVASVQELQETIDKMNSEMQELKQQVHHLQKKQ